MATLGLLLLVGMALIDALVGVAEFRVLAHADRRFVLHSLRGVGLILLLSSKSALTPEAAQRLAAAVALLSLGWFAYGTLLLVRHLPRGRNLPRQLRRFGWLDLAIVTRTAVGGAVLTYGKL